jgi:hypothetical protein
MADRNWNLHAQHALVLVGCDLGLSLQQLRQDRLGPGLEDLAFRRQSQLPCRSLH